MALLRRSSPSRCLARSTTPSRSSCVRERSGRLLCANTGRSPSARRTRQVDPKRKFLVRERIDGVRHKAEVPPKCRSPFKERGLRGDLFVKSAARHRLRQTSRCSQARQTGVSAFSQVIAVLTGHFRDAECAAVAEATRGWLRAGRLSAPNRRRFAPLAQESPGNPVARWCCS